MRVILLLCLVGMTACAGPTAPAPIDRQILLGPGQSALIPQTAVAIRFLGVANDSRCPADAMCVTGGSARVDVQVTAGTGGALVVAFETGSPQPVQFGSLTLTLVSLMPYPLSSQPIDPADYRVTLRVIR